MFFSGPVPCCGEPVFFCGLGVRVWGISQGEESYPKGAIGIGNKLVRASLSFWHYAALLDA